MQNVRKTFATFGIYHSSVYPKRFIAELSPECDDGEVVSMIQKIIIVIIIWFASFEGQQQQRQQQQRQQQQRQQQQRQQQRHHLLIVISAATFFVLQQGREEGLPSKMPPQQCDQKKIAKCL